MATEISNSTDILYVRDIIERFEELENTDPRDEYEEGEYKILETLLNDLRGNGGDEKWRGDWYPLTLIREDYFEDYCEELVSDIGDMPREIPSYIVVDWQKTADNIRVDYGEIDFDGETYLYR